MSSSEEVVRIKVVLDTGYAGAKHEDEAEYPKEQWDSWSPEEKASEMESYIETMVSNYIEGWWEVIDE